MSGRHAAARIALGVEWYIGVVPRFGNQRAGRRWRTLRSFLRLCLLQFLKLIKFRACFRGVSRTAVNSAQCIVWLRVRGIKSRGQLQLAYGLLIPAPLLEQHTEYVMCLRKFRIS